MEQNQKQFSSYTAKSVDEILKELGSNADTGLSQEEVAKRRTTYGYNRLEITKTAWYLKLIKQFASPFTYLLLGAALVSFIFQNNFEGLVILLIVAINGCAGFYQEYKADRVLHLLKKYLISYVRVIRKGQEIKIVQEELVPGDIIILYPGDIIPADVRIISHHNFTVDESALTGESVPVHKKNDILAQETQELYKAENIGFAGTVVAAGKATAIVFATGKNTTFGSLASLTATTDRISSFAKMISIFSRFIMYMMVISLVLIFVANLLIKGRDIDIIELILFSAALAITVIPEALPIVTTFALSQGALHLAQKKTIVKRLSAIEDLGNIEILCTDKTGTITENILTIKNIYGEKPREVLLDASLAGNFSTANRTALKGFDRAYYAAMTPEERKYVATHKRIVEFPFDPVRRNNAMIVQKGDIIELVVVGAVEALIPRCPALQKDFASYRDWIAQEGEEGYRLLAVAKKEITLPERGSYEGLDQGDDLQFVGAISFEDPLKKTAVQAIAKAQKFGIECKIISGDAPEVCAAVAHKIGLITDRKAVITGALLEQKNEHEKREIVKKYHVFSRISPQQKCDIIKLLQEEKEVGYVGDGINDAPALKQASVALAVHDAADIAREASDIILLEKSLLIIINGIIEGRKIFANVIKYLRTALSSNFGNFYSMATVSLFLPYLPILPVQILLLNMFADFPMIAIATDNVGPKQLERAGRYNVRSIAFLAVILGAISSLFDFIFFRTFYHYPPEILQTSWFIESILSSLAFIFSIRTTKFFFKGTLPSLPLAGLALGIAIISMGLPHTSLGQRLFYFAPIPATNYYWIFLIIVAYFITTDCIKVLFFRIVNGQPKKV